MPRNLPVQLTASPDADLVNYRALPWQAVVSLILGVLSPAALIDPMLWAVPVLGIFFSVWALRRIKRNCSTLTGRKRAVLGLTLALLSAVAAPTDRLMYRWLLRSQAQQVADAWFQLLLQDHPLAAGKMVIAPPPPHVPEAIAKVAPQKLGEVDRFGNTPLAKTLLAMGPRAQVRFYEPWSQTRDSNRETVELVYTVTYDDASQSKPLPVLVRLSRRTFSSGKAEWRIAQTEGGVPPKS